VTSPTGPSEPHEQPLAGLHAHHSHTGGRGPLADASVRLARESDAPAVGVVQAAVWHEAYAGVLGPEVLAAFQPQEFARVWRESLARPPAGIYRLLVACAGEQVVGFAAIGPTQDPDAGPATGEVLALGVHPEARRQGHGSRLLNACIDTLRGAGADTVHAWILLEDSSSRVFLEAAGLRPDGAFRDRIVAAEGETAREVRLRAQLAADTA
jgi:ribosomal protein S18 acetylase RimI-like enzyme